MVEVSHITFAAEDPDRLAGETPVPDLDPLRCPLGERRVLRTGIACVDFGDASLRAATGIPAYDASKAALLGICRQVAREGTARGIRANLVVPSLVDAMFTGFPGQNGETVRITVPPARRPARKRRAATRDRSSRRRC